jgi:hypothetical protein
VLNPPEFVDVAFAEVKGGTTGVLEFLSVVETLGGGGEEDEGTKGGDDTVVLEGGGAD